MKLSIVAGATSQTVNIFVQDSSKTDGSGLTGLVFNSSGLTAYYVFPRAASAAITLATLAAATSAYSSGGFKEIDSTNCPGLYRLDLPNAVLASGNGRFVTVYLRGATNMAPCVLEIELTGWDNQDGVHGGLTSLPNAAAGANGGLPTGDASGRVAIQVGTSAGQINSSSGKVPATLAAADVSGNVATDVQTIKGQTVTCSGAVTVLASVGTASTSTAQTGDSFARLGAPAGASVSADIASVKSDSSGLRTDYTTARAAKLDNLDATVSSRNATAPLTAQQTANAVWDEPTSNHQTAGTTGKALSTASAAGDPWATQLPGSYAAGTAGRIVGGTPNTYAQQGSGDTPLIGR